VKSDLRRTHDPKPVLEANLRATVEAEEITRKVTEASIAERARKSVRDPERALELRHTQRGRERYEGEVRLSEVDIEIGIVLRRLSLSRYRSRDC
jgi:hypothetical protein